MYEGLKQKIAERERRLAELDRERIVVETEVRAYQDALTLILAATPPKSASVTPGRRRTLAWSDILAPFAKTPGELFSVEDIVRSSTERGITVPTRGNVRSQMGALVQRNKAERVSEGIFRFTQEGAVEIGLIGLDETEELAADTDEESAA